MSIQRNMSELISDIQKSQGILEARIQALDTAAPSFETGISDALQKDLQATLARKNIENASMDLNRLMKGPQGIITTPPHNIHMPVHAVAKFDLANTIPVDRDEGKTYEEIAHASSLDETVVKRVIKTAITLHIFKEQPVGVVRHNAASRYLATTPEMRQWLLMVMEELWPAATKVVEALQKYPSSQEPHEAAYGIAHNTTQGAFGLIASQPERSKRFADSMTWFSSGPGLEASHLANGYPWSEVENGKVVDVGGSFGAVSMEVATKFPSISFIIQDRSEVVEVGQNQLPPNFSQISFMSHDFFTEQPIKDANVYLLRTILHDWSDSYCVKILRNLIPALKAGGVLLVMEQILPEPGQLDLNTEQAIRAYDLAMLALANGRERDVEDWKILFTQVDPRLQISRIFRPPASRMGLIEAKMQG